MKQDEYMIVEVDNTHLFSHFISMISGHMYDPLCFLWAIQCGAFTRHNEEKQWKMTWGYHRDMTWWSILYHFKDISAIKSLIFMGISSWYDIVFDIDEQVEFVIWKNFKAINMIKVRYISSLLKEVLNLGPNRILKASHFFHTRH